jgi:hypothetical protein
MPKVLKQYGRILDISEKRTPLPSWRVFHYLTVRGVKPLWIKLLSVKEVFYNPLPTIIRADLSLVVLRIFHGKGRRGMARLLQEKSAW